MLTLCYGMTLDELPCAERYVAKKLYCVNYFMRTAMDYEQKPSLQNVIFHKHNNNYINLEGVIFFLFNQFLYTM